MRSFEASLNVGIEKKCVLFYKISGLISPRLTLGKTRSPADSAALEAGQPEAAGVLGRRSQRSCKAFVSDSWDK